jgi:hypothetical protein
MRELAERAYFFLCRALGRSLRAGRYAKTRIAIDPGGVLVLPCLPGRTLAASLEDPDLAESARKRAIELAVRGLAELHELGFTHGDAMAENVMVDLEAGAAHWFDFETLHDASRPLAWRRSDDVRALLATCLLRTDPDKVAATLHLLLDLYADDEVTRLVATSFGSVLGRPLTFHLGQAGLSFQDYRQIARSLRQRVGDPPGSERA